MIALALLAVLFFARGLALIGRDLDWSGRLIMALTWQDFVVVSIFLGLTLATRLGKAGGAARFFVPLFFWAIVFYTALNVAVVRVLGTPITPALWRAAHGALSDSIQRYLTPANIASILLVPIIAGVLVRASRNRGMQPGWQCLALAALVACAAVGQQSASKHDTGGFERNALFALAMNARPSLRTGEEFTDWRRSLSQENPKEDFTALRGLARGRNVVLIALESTGSKHLKPWGGAHDPMPALTALTEDALMFENAYAVYPESVKGLYAVLCSAYPAFNTRAESYERRGPTALPQALQTHQAALFHSGRFDYLGMDEIIRRRGFDLLLDAASLDAGRESSFGIDEPITVDAMLRWIDGRSADRPFLLTYLPVAGHHPYITPNGEFSGRSEMERYLNSLRHADEALAQLIEGFKDRGLYENTLFVIHGDHGEAFEEHDANIGHTLFIYEENLRVPLLFVAPGAIRGEHRVRRPVSLIDIAPTVADLLGHSAAPDWQGASLLHPSPRPVYFFTDYSLGLLGVRDGDKKLIYELESARAKLYNLGTDPGERMNIAAAEPELSARFRSAVLSWSIAQRANFDANRPPSGRQDGI